MPSERQRVMVINSGSVFDTSLLQLVQTAVLDVAVVSGHDEFVLTQALIQYQPQIVIMNDSENGLVSRLLKMFGELQSVRRLRIIVVQIADNVILQYDLKSVIATESAALLALIGSD